MGHISMIGKTDANTLRARAPRIAPGWTLEKMAEHTLSFWLTSEDLPHPDSRVTVDRDGRITLSYTPNNEEGHKRLIAKLKGMLKEIRCDDHLIPLNAYIPARIPLAGVAHQNGTVRFGRDSRTSASTSTARPTRWTTSTSSTRASSPRAATLAAFLGPGRHNAQSRTFPALRPVGRNGSYELVSNREAFAA